jgi:hypothetical protein
VSGRSGGCALLPGGSAVHAHWGSEIAVTLLELAFSVVSRDVLNGRSFISKELGKEGEGTNPVTAHLVVNVVAQLGSITTDACTDAELLLRDEASPLVVLSVGSKAGTEHQTTSCRTCLALIGL